MSAFYRKYRPQTLDDLIGQPQVQSLKTAFSQNKLSHAYLFCGPRGTGKTSTARILAKMVNCQGKNPPCNECELCLSVTDSSNLDLIEIDAASNRGIDDVRTLRENLKLTPSKALKKVYIIDEVHMLTTEAFNALLKTLEEPPAHVLFILATTEVHKIPETILSRVTRLNFKLATLPDLEKALQQVSDLEKIQIDAEARHLIAKAAQGSFRDGLKILDQLSSNGKITAASVEQSVQSGDFEQITSLLTAIASKDASLALKLFSQSLGTINLKEYLLATMDLLRLMLFIKHSLVELVKDDLGSTKTPVLLSLSQRFSLKQLIHVIDCLQGAYEKMRYASIPSLPLEIALVESCAVTSFEAESPEKQEIKDSKITMITTKATAQSEKPIDTGRDGLAVPEIKMVVVGGKDSENLAKNEDMLTIIDKWNYILETVKPLNFSLEALLRSVKILDCLDSQVIIEVPYTFHQRILETPKSRDLLESVLSDVLAKSVKIKTVIGKRPQRLEELQNVEIAADDEIIKIASEIFSSDAP